MSDVVAVPLLVVDPLCLLFGSAFCPVIPLDDRIAFWVLQKVSRGTHELQSLLLFLVSTGFYEIGGIEIHFARRFGYTRPTPGLSFLDLLDFIT